MDIGKHLKTVLTKMCEYVEVDYEAVDFTKDKWYQEHTWTFEQAKDFETWFFNYLANNEEARNEIMRTPIRQKKWLMRFVKQFESNYGWKYSDLMDIE
jgi:hypothetical protein